MWDEILETKRLLDLSLDECKKRGLEEADAQAAYYTAKAKAAYELKEDGNPATFISLVIKGIKEVNDAMRRYRAAQVRYENAKEARLVYKKWLDILNDEYKREWGAV